MQDDPAPQPVKKENGSIWKQMAREFIIKISDEILEEEFDEPKPLELVRCKDCKHATMTVDGKMCKYCEMDTDDFGDQRDVYHDADWFCADGERG
jgi:hypothetical protein